MKTQPKTQSPSKPDYFDFFGQTILPVLFSSLFLFSPFLVDVKITRPKLFFFEIGIAAVIALWAIAGIIKGEVEIKKTSASLPVLFFTGVITLFYFLSPNPHLSVTELRRVLICSAAFFAASTFIDTHRKRKIFFYMFSAGTLWAAIYGILQRSGGIWIIGVPQMERVFSTFGNPIFFGAYLVLAIPIILGLFLGEKNVLARVYFALVVVASGIALFYTETRSSWIAFGISILLFILLGIKDRSKKIILMAALAAAATIFFYLTKNIWLRHQGHFLIWKDTLQMWLSSPIVGVGLGLFHIRFPEFASRELREIWPQAVAIVNDAHNEYLQLLSETGIIGFSAFAIIIVVFLFSVFRQSPDNRDYLHSGIFCGVTAILFQNIFSVDLRFVISGIYLFTFIGLSSSWSAEEVEFKIRQIWLRVVLAVAAVAATIFVGSKIVEPYTAVKREAARPDFFDERILDASKTISELEALAAKHPEQFLVFEKLGWVYAKEKNFAKAIENYSRAIEINPDNPGPYNNIGNIYFLMNQHAKAIEFYLQSIAINGNQIDARINLALAYYHKGELGPAAEQLKEVLRLDPGNEKATILMKKMRE